MCRKIAFVIYYQKQNIYSFNAIIAAIETENQLDDIDFFFIRGHENLLIDLERIINSHITTVVGISFFTTQLWEISDLIKSLREKYKKDIFIIAGGPHPTGDPEGTLKMGFDLVVRGEGERTVIEILKNIKNNKKFNEVEGIAYLGKERILFLLRRGNGSI